MSNILTIGFITEGKTDFRFLKSIIYRTFHEISYECTGEIEIYEPEVIHVKEEGFISKVLKAAEVAFEHGLNVICVHTDADDYSKNNVLINKINPAFKAINETTIELCRNKVPIIPIQMTEAWLLADIDLLKEEIGTTKSADELGINRKPESITDPKSLIEEVIRIAFSDLTLRQRKRQNTIYDLYQPIGLKLNLSLLERLSSYKNFKDDVRNAFRYLNYLV